MVKWIASRNLSFWFIFILSDNLHFRKKRGNSIFVLAKRDYRFRIWMKAQVSLSPTSIRVKQYKVDYVQTNGPLGLCLPSYLCIYTLPLYLTIAYSFLFSCCPLQLRKHNKYLLPYMHRFHMPIVLLHRIDRKYTNWIRRIGYKL